MFSVLKFDSMRFFIGLAIIIKFFWTLLNENIAYLALETSYRSLFIKVVLSIHSLKEVLDEINGLKKFSVPKIESTLF